MIIQIVLIILICALLIKGLYSRGTHSGKAWKKIALVLLGMSMVFVIIFPDTTNTVAHIFGVGRGADLLLYVLTISFIFYALNNYLQQQDQRAKINKLARKIAILETKRNVSSNSDKK